MITKLPRFSSKIILFLVLRGSDLCNVFGNLYFVLVHGFVTIDFSASFRAWEKQNLVIGLFTIWFPFLFASSLKKSIKTSKFQTWVSRHRFGAGSSQVTTYILRSYNSSGIRSCHKILKQHGSIKTGPSATLSDSSRIRRICCATTISSSRGFFLQTSRGSTSFWICNTAGDTQYFNC